MTALEIKSLKILMTQLLAGNTFDIFLLENATITTSVTYTIDGHINSEFFQGDSDEAAFETNYEYIPWKEIKELCYSLIKGRYTPLNFKFTLRLKPEQMENLYQKKLPSADITQLKALILIIRYDNTLARVTTGVSYQGFTMDKEPEKVWDINITKYLSEKGIVFEEI